MEGPVTLVYVDEINWAEEVGSVRQILRFSKMHALNLLEIMKAAKNKDFTHAFIFDHDLIFKDDFIGWMMRERPNTDMVCSLLGNRTNDEKIASFLGEQFVFAPKPSAWHMMISRKVFDILVDHGDLVLPGFENGKMYDTLSLAYHYVSRWGMVVKTYTEEEMARHIQHIWSMSMNYGMTHAGIDSYRNKLDWFEREYDARFPNGIGDLLKKLER
jgi:hypothetical protein